MRQATLVALALAAGLCTTAQLSNAQSAGGPLTVAASGGSFQDALTRNFYQRFEKQTGAKVVHVPVEGADQFNRARAMARTGKVEWDVMSPEPQSFYRDQDLFERLDCSRIPNAQKLGVPGTCGEFGIFRAIGGGVLSYSTKAFPKDPPQSWADFWNVQKYPGPRCLPGILPHYVIAAALQADGVPADKLFPLDINRAMKKLQQIKPHVAVWWSSGNQSMDTLRKGECVMSWMWSGRILQLMAEGQPLNITFNQSHPVFAYWSIVKGTPNKDLAYKFLDFWMTEPDAHVAFSKEIFYDTANTDALKKLSAAEASLRATSEANLKKQVPFDWKWVADNSDAMRAAFQDMLTR